MRRHRKSSAQPVEQRRSLPHCQVDSSMSRQETSESADANQAAGATRAAAGGDCIMTLGSPNYATGDRKSETSHHAHSTSQPPLGSMRHPDQACMETARWACWTGRSEPRPTFPVAVDMLSSAGIRRSSGLATPGGTWQKVLAVAQR